MPLQLITQLMINYIEVPHVFTVGSNLGQTQPWNISEFLRIALRYRSPPSVPIVKMLQFYAKNSRLNFIESRIRPDEVMDVFFAASVVAKRSNAGSYLGIVSGHGAPVTESPQVFPRIEAPRHGMAMRADPLTGIARPMRLRSILHNDQPVFPCQCQELVKVCGLAEEVYRNNSARSRSNCMLYPSRIQGPLTNDRLNAHRTGADAHHREPRCDEGVRWHDDLITGANSECL
ncbi:hypothetical protein A5791_06755 [Mycobacterium sp. 852002-51163_SCH5372311]|nr:hypothetical protein A5791_06755 [Mycobacterium sp. 852002-51163_SCH5372311]